MKKILLITVLSSCAGSVTLAQNIKSNNSSNNINAIKAKTKSGLQYKIIPTAKQNPLIKTGQIVKFNTVVKLNDSILYSTYGKLPSYTIVKKSQVSSYNLEEILPLMKNGDSAVTVQLADTLIKKGINLPSYIKKGDKIVTTLCITKVFSSDSVARADFNIEMEKDKPRQEKEQAEMLAKLTKEREEQRAKDEKELTASGEVAKELQEIETYLANKKINAQKTGKGTYVQIRQRGTVPLADSGKYVTVKYVGKLLDTDSVFEDNTYTFQLGQSPVIQGWDEGIRLFGKGGEGTLYVPGFLAYGKSDYPFKPFAALIFDIIIEDIKDRP